MDFNPLNFFQRNRFKSPPSAKPDDEFYYTQTGRTGTRIYGGEFDDDYLNKLKGHEAADIYDKMRRSDSQVAMLIKLIVDPIKSANWYIDPGTNEQEDKDIAEFIQYCLFDDIANPDGSCYKSWKRFLTEALTFVVFGFSAFEVVHKIVTNHSKYGNYVGLRSLGFRNQRSIWYWNVNDEGRLISVEQFIEADNTKQTTYIIPGNSLLIFNNQQEGDNYAGISMLRPIYGNYMRKQVYYKLQAMGIERGATGVPWGKMKDDAPNPDVNFKQMAEILKKFTSGEYSFVCSPPGFEMAELKITHDADKVRHAIDNEDMKMSKAFLAHFMELGSGSVASGSYALGSDLSDFFLGTIQSFADTICEQMNYQVIRKLVKANFGDREYYPKLRCAGINDKAGREFADIIIGLGREGLIQKSDTLYKFIHDTFGFPEFDEDAVIPVEETNAQDAVIVASEAQEDTIMLDEGPKHPAYLQIEGKAATLEQFMRDKLTAVSDSLISRIRNVLSNEENRDKWREIATDQELIGLDRYEQELLEQFAQISVDAKRQALREVGLNDKLKLDEMQEILEELPDDVEKRIKSEAKIISNDQFASLAMAVMLSVNKNIDQHAATGDIAGLVSILRKSRDEYVTGPAINSGSVTIASDIINGTRYATFMSPEVAPEIESYVFYNPDPVSEICKNLNGKVFTEEEYESSGLLPPLHHRCKSVIIPQSRGNRDNKPVTGLAITGTKDQIARAEKSISIR